LLNTLISKQRML